MIGRASTTQLAVFGSEPFSGTTDDTLVGVFEAEVPSFGGSTGDTLVGVFGGGGVGYSWFELELTSERAGAWFELELTSEHVGPVTPPVIPRPGPVSPPRPRRRRVTYRAAGRFTVVESIEVRARGYFYVDRERRFAGRYEVVASVQQTFNANYVVSNLHTLLLEEDELLLLMEE